ncbi:hypothetical protein H072_10604 [Dactylellina haptotyla CBS 200.50]|uniref:3-oxo-5-alpha-steroid 4-dehydrogenase C-terminal domain-containing protein n=1 Tax=Dactylellina haptotyla (strain CBS 200.50) TaxID=1284197 RepID=S8BA10_DACHA|nr:hypothetical protein H072_10604 [Dactylellina haptotyla CBS 200.50]
MKPIIFTLLYTGIALAQYSCKPLCSSCSYLPATKSASCVSLIETIGIPRPECTVTTTLGASTVIVTETAVVTTFITPTVTFLQTRTFSNTSIAIVTESLTTTETGISFDIITVTETVPTLTVTEDPITVTATARRRRLKGRYYPRLDPDCSCFLTRTQTVTVTPPPGATLTEVATTTATEYSTITYNSTVSTTVVGTTVTSTTIGNGTVTFLTTETITGTDIITTALTTVTVQSTVTAPAVQLSSPTPVFGDIVNGSPSNYDDVWATLTIPFPIEMYNVSTSVIYLSVNGFLSLDELPGTSFINSELPVADSVSGANRLPNTSICALWDDLYIYFGTQQGIYYQIDGSPAMEKDTITLRVQPRGKPLPNLPAELPISASASTEDLYRAVAKLTKTSVHSVRITKSDSSHLKPSSEVTLADAPLYDESQIFVKNLGTQIDWQTVFLIEYFGPLFIHPLFFLFRKQIYSVYPPFWQWSASPLTTPPTQTQYILCGIILLHYIKRELETLFVHRFSSATMPVASLIRNTAYYWTVGGLYLGYFLYMPTKAETPPHFLYTGLAIWVFAQLSNFKTHLTLRDLRRPGTKDRGIPRGYGFNLVTCPNYMFEVLGWFAVAMITGWRIPALVFWLSGSYIQHKWAGQKERRYRREFGDRYKKKRAVIIPYLL